MMAGKQIPLEYVARASNDAGPGAIKLYKAGKDGPWPSDMHAYYTALDKERGIPEAKLIQGYKK